MRRSDAAAGRWISSRERGGRRPDRRCALVRRVRRGCSRGRRIGGTRHPRDGAGHRCERAGGYCPRHPQDSPRHRDHAGEPLLRHVLRHLSGGRRDPAEERRTGGVRPGSGGQRVRQTVPRSGRRQRGRAARGACRERRYRRRAHGRVHRRAAAGSPDVVQERQLAGLQRRGERRSGRNGLSRPARAAGLLGIRAQLRAAGPHVRVERVVEPAVASVPRLRVVGTLRER